MLELNQPNHAYDLATLGGNGIRVRLATDGEALTTLDGTTRVLTTEELLICDAHDVPIGLAGIMGGEHTEIAGSTSMVALEFAWFEPLGIAASIVRTGLRSDASARWERGVDAYGIDTSIARFVELLSETCPTSWSTTEPSTPAPSIPAGDAEHDVARQPSQADHRRGADTRRCRRAAQPDRLHASPATTRRR